MKRYASVQTSHLRLEAIADDVICLGQGQYRAVLEVAGIHFGLLGQAEQEAVLAGFAAWLNGLAYPVQLLVQVTPLNLDRYLDALERRAAGDLPPALVSLASNHATFLQGLARQRTLLERHLFVVVPAGEGMPRPRWPFDRRPDLLDAATSHRQLAARCDEVVRGLGRCRLGVRRITTLELANLLYACWCPERARLQRLRTELTEYATLSVRAVPRAERSA